MPTMPPSSQLAQLIGSSVAIAAVRDRIDALTGAASPVLVTGPAGSGKRVVAALLHQRGGRAARPFVAVDCTFGGDDLARTLFGDDGAMNAASPGAVSAARGGTLFLDGVSGAACLGAILARERIGSAGSRVVASMRGDRAAITGHDRGFSHWPGVETIAVPALADRRSDIPLLVDHFIGLGERDRPRFTAAALDYLTRQPWPENVRQLAGVVARAAARHAGRTVDEPAAALLVHGERRTVDRWLATAASPLPMPNRRRPPPIVAAAVVDVRRMLTGHELRSVATADGPRDPAPRPGGPAPPRPLAAGDRGSV